MNQTKGTWTLWVDEHYEVLLSRATVLFRGQTELASDFLHDVLLELRRKWDHIEHPLGWISTTMRYRVVDYLKTQKAQPEAEPERFQAPNDLSLQVDIMDIEAAIRRLPNKLQVVMTLFLEGNSIGDIASKTGLSPDAVYQRLSRARKRLKAATATKGSETKRPSGQEVSCALI
ncbi:MAG: hypothetical protein CL920_27390 [Deltaproteobacteria bacterium]|nr:hypothetical protein [Deltaproteobacteria bacterium]MBU52436.1 hypothetical protein [Deltaproteobacteria bacterium]|tara:strand:+ start:21025 stop:21546 length:522 start_codon:yes stop_codon:yes gene_type:complete